MKGVVGVSAGSHYVRMDGCLTRTMWIASYLTSALELSRPSDKSLGIRAIAVRKEVGPGLSIVLAALKQEADIIHSNTTQTAGNSCKIK